MYMFFFSYLWMWRLVGQSIALQEEAIVYDYE